MERKIFGQKGRLSSPKKHLLKIISLIRGSGNSDLGVASYVDANGDQAQVNIYNAQSYNIRNQRMHEIEAQKAMAVLESRHERWKAGGPL